ncbi:hypothetical protein [Glycomyces xiaoerkulensis]|uniref:hypothetical protein n=1 Tax=Glycomyces xiaoerkulensis TaxID=2038139 RepID=UPI0018E47246|nr:hypothetical protein [Glycomyces xiaoerkulensis]
MNRFSRTMLASSAEAGLTQTALSRHVPLLCRNVRPGERVSLLTGCVGSDGLAGGDCILMLTSERLVVTRQSRMLGRVRPCLDAPIRGVEHFRWSADPKGPGVDLGFTVPEGAGAAGPGRWHFWLPAEHAKRVWRIDAVLAREFRRPGAVAEARPMQPMDFDPAFAAALLTPGDLREPGPRGPARPRTVRGGVHAFTGAVRRCST